MYQLGLSPATAEVPSMSAVALGANRWASRVVVVLQLAAWSAVGIVLLQKGASSLQKTPLDVANVTTKENHTEAAIANLITRRLSVDGEGNSFVPDDFRDPEYSDTENHRDTKNDDEIVGKTIPAVIPIALKTSNHLSNDKNSVSNSEKSPFQNQHSSKNNVPINDGEEKEHSMESTTSSLSTSSTTSETYDKISETRKKLAKANLNGGGAAAAAVAMVAVGAVMLVLGPVVIILRGLDERRQERRFLKLSGQDDLPPSYEQATLMDEAPRYSTLSLNTIGCSPVAGSSSSSNDPARAGGICEV